MNPTRKYDFNESDADIDATLEASTYIVKSA